MSETEYAAYVAVLNDVAGFLDKPPSRWTRGDLRRFYAANAPQLHHEDIVRYRRALGILAEVLQKMPAPRRPTPSRTERFPRTPSQTSRVLNDPNDNEIVGWDEAPTKAASRPVGTWDSAFDGGSSSSFDDPIDAGDSSREWRSGFERRHTSVNSGFERRTTRSGFGPRPATEDEDDSILIVVDDGSVDPRTGDISSLDITGGSTHGLCSDDVVAAFFGDDQTGTNGTGHHETPSPFERRKSVAKTGQMRAVHRGTPASPVAPVAAVGELSHQVDARGWAELRWSGFVASDLLRRELVAVSNLIDSRGLFGLMANMRGASVLGQRDTRWFCEWVVDAVQRGIQRLAIVSPSNPTARLQLSRLVRELRADWFAAPATQRFELEFFHHTLAARTWLDGA